MKRCDIGAGNLGRSMAISSAGGAHIVAFGTDTGVDLGCEDHVLAGNVEILERLPEGLLTFTLRVDIRRIEQIDPSIDCTLDELVGSFLVDGTDDFIDR